MQFFIDPVELGIARLIREPHRPQPFAWIVFSLIRIDHHSTILYGGMCGTILPATAPLAPAANSPLIRLFARYMDSGVFEVRETPMMTISAFRKLRGRFPVVVFHGKLDRFHF